MLSPSTHGHLQPLARLAAVMQVEVVQQELEQKVCLEALCTVLREAGSQFNRDEIPALVGQS